MPPFDVTRKGPTAASTRLAQLCVLMGLATIAGCFAGPELANKLFIPALLLGVACLASLVIELVVSRIRPSAATVGDLRYVAAAVGVTFGASVLLPFLPSEGPQAAKARNVNVQAEIADIRLGLEVYAADHRGQYPATVDLVQLLGDRRQKYLEGNDAPPGPWSRGRQRVALPPDHPRLVTAAVLARGAARPRIGLALGEGHVPMNDGPPRGPLDYGATLYDYDPKSRVYVLYGVGQQGKQAVLAAETDNLPTRPSP